MTDGERDKVHQMLGWMYSACNGEKTKKTCKQIREDFEHYWEHCLADAQREAVK